MSIKQLSVQVANQIAAGEVVERPASVVKELVENSVDAGASRIDIDIEHGGSKLIRIRDNGCGIAGDELALALMRHATSKISTLDDLQAIDSLGFRGEALASISSVSRLLLTSCQQGQQQAWQAYAEGRDMQVSVKPAAHPQGTTLEVRDLFFNTPARRKFLRTEKTEFMHIDEVIRRIALARFEVSFILSHNGKLLRQYRALAQDNPAERRLEAICGSAFMRQALTIDWQHGDLALTGWLSLSATEEIQYSYVNGRMIRDRLINHAIRQAVQQSGSERLSAGWVLFLTLNPEQVDVNVHPAKQEVRFHQSRLVHDFVCQGLTRVLQHALPLQNRAAAGKNSFQTQSDLPQAASGCLQEHQATPYVARPDTGDAGAVNGAAGQAVAVNNSAVNEGVVNKDIVNKDIVNESAVKDSAVTASTPVSDHHTIPRPATDNSSQYSRYGGRYGNDVSCDQRQQHALYQQLVTAQTATASDYPPVDQQQSFGRLLAIVQSKFALLERKAQIQLLSLSTASQLLAEHRLSAELSAEQYPDSDTSGQQNASSSQPLLIPLRLPVSAKEAKYLAQAQSGLATLGMLYSLEGHYMVISGLPLPLRQQNLHIFIPRLTDYLVECGKFDQVATVRWLAQQISAEQQQWTMAQAITLLTQLERCCPTLLASAPDYLLSVVDLQAAMDALQHV